MLRWHEKHTAYSKLMQAWLSQRIPKSPTLCLILIAFGKFVLRNQRPWRDDTYARLQPVSVHFSGFVLKRAHDILTHNGVKRAAFKLKIVHFYIFCIAVSSSTLDGVSSRFREHWGYFMAMKAHLVWDKELYYDLIEYTSDNWFGQNHYGLFSILSTGHTIFSAGSELQPYYPNMIDAMSFADLLLTL